MDDDGTNPFGSHAPDGGTLFINWDTPEWRAAMQVKYGDSE